ncbi:hypothetical protein N9B48_01775 [bacterium]|jgi:hypothetical protein|nr:hypothetical protein [bacterium]MDA7901731.1 hypothetical protein [bacterium]
MSLMSELMRESVDYAGLFPPASLTLDAVVANYHQYVNSNEHSMLGRLIIPASRLSEYSEIRQSQVSDVSAPNRPWQISALVPPIEGLDATDRFQKFESAIELIQKFNTPNNQENTANDLVDAIEVKTPNLTTVEATIARLPSDIHSFLELPHTEDPSDLINRIASEPSGKNLFAKIRTGGTAAHLIPTPEQVARFIWNCASSRVAFKATAGLHHPIRSDYRLTYESDSKTATMFGFLNVFYATMMSWEHAISIDELTEILSATEPTQFRATENEILWGDRMVQADRVKTLRSQSIISFGSCSFLEPTTELQDIPGQSHKSLFPA